MPSAAKTRPIRLERVLSMWEWASGSGATLLAAPPEAKHSKNLQGKPRRSKGLSRQWPALTFGREASTALGRSVKMPHLSGAESNACQQFQNRLLRACAPTRRSQSVREPTRAKQDAGAYLPAQSLSAALGAVAASQLLCCSAATALPDARQELVASCRSCAIDVLCAAMLGLSTPNKPWSMSFEGQSWT